MSDTATRDDILTDEEVALNRGDWGEGLAHYALKDGLVEAMIYGTPVMALCGWRFIPRRDPLRLPVCQRCAEIRNMLPPGGEQ